MNAIPTDTIYKKIISYCLNISDTVIKAQAGEKHLFFVIVNKKLKIQVNFSTGGRSILQNHNEIAAIRERGDKKNKTFQEMNANITLNTKIITDMPNSKENFLNLFILSVPVLMGIFLFFNPFSHTTAIKEICFYLSLFIVLILVCFKKINFSFKSPLTLPFALFTVWAFIGLFSALYKENSLNDFYEHLLKYMVFYYIMINFKKAQLYMF